jgi:protein-S-isoprenylcysteine O-methyltransferase Ste14
VTLTRIRVPLGFAVAGAVLYLATPSVLSILAGLPVALFGLLFRAAAAGVIQKNRVLAEDGPYRFTRNPLYFGSFLLAAGFGVMSASLLCVALLVIPFTVVYSQVIRREEAHLSDLFPDDFAEFRKRVPAFLPRRPNAGLLESFSRDQYMSNREYHAALGFAAVLTVFLIKALV